MFYVIECENGAFRYGNFNSYNDAIDYAESNNKGYAFTVSEYDRENDYYESI